MPPPTHPRTSTVYFFLPPLLLLSCAGLSVGLTFAPCYSSLCVEQYFPYQTRIHIALYYSLLAGICLFLATRVLFRPFRNLSEWHLSNKIVPFSGRRLSLGGLLLFVWVAGLTFGCIGYWYPAENAYWTARGALVDWTEYMYRVIWTGVTGHWCDIWIGLVVMPVGRNSILGRVFHLHTSTLLFAHKLLAYGLCVGALIHGLLYYTFLAAWVSVTSIDDIREQFVPDNPLVTWPEAAVKGPYSWFTLPTGAISGIVLIPIMVVTSLPVLRRINYNTFYFIHIILAFLVILLVCLHASTSFYFLLPGLLLWVSDWVWRIRYALGTRVDVQVENAGHGWYRLRLPQKLIAPSEGPHLEKGKDTVSLSHPMATYYVNISQISQVQIHPFTAVSVESSKAGPVLLFQRSPERKKAKKRDMEWTWQVGALADSMSSEKQVTLNARIEGPYSPYVPELYAADHILAIAGGTGITGALSITTWWAANFGGELPSQKSLRLVWTVRRHASSQVQEVEEMQALIQGMPNMHCQIHVSSESGRLSPHDELSNFLSQREARKGRAWVYVSGPDGLMASSETACVQQKRALRSAKDRTGVTELDWHVTRYSV